MLKRILVAVMLFVGASLSGVQAQIEVDITRGSDNPVPIAIPDFKAGPGAEELAKQISEVVRNDLVSTGRFKTIDPAAFIQKDLSISLQPRFADWRIINSDALVVGEVSLDSDGIVSTVFRIWDVQGGELYRLTVRDSATDQLVESGGGNFRINKDDWRRIAHKTADAIYTRLTGDDGIFDSRIVYIAESGPKTNRVKRLAIMDSDGANQVFLTEGRNRILTPRFSTSDQEITYMSFEGGRPRVYLFNLRNGRQEVLGNFPGMTFAPRFSPDGRSVVMSQALNGNSDLYLMDLRTRQTRRLTDHPAIDTSPSMSADGRQVTFTSDRGGSPQIYVMNTDGSPLTCPSGGQDKACRITFGRGNYSTPVWSPRGDLIAFTKQVRGKFHIGVIGTDGQGERLLSEAYLDEGPAWSPNGRVITFFRESRPGAGPKLYSIDLTGRNLRQLQTTTDASDPAWSPLLK